MAKHIVIAICAVAIGLAAGFGGQIALHALAVISLIGGPGLYDALNRLAERQDVFWIVAGAVALSVAVVLYAVWGLIRLLGGRRKKDGKP
jgi:hypothetical protein